MEGKATKIKGLNIFVTYSPLNEDPVTVTYWIANKEGEKFKLNPEGIQQALKSIGFKPTTKQEALEAATLEYAYGDNYQVFLNKPFGELDLPFNIKDKIDVPRIEKIDRGFRVTFFTYKCSRTARWFKINTRYLEKHVIEVGDDFYNEVSREIIWSIERKIE